VVLVIILRTPAVVAGLCAGCTPIPELSGTWESAAGFNNINPVKVGRESAVVSSSALGFISKRSPFSRSM
jgi:hypothetical protein